MYEQSIRQRSRLFKTLLCRRLATRPATLAEPPEDWAIVVPPVRVLEPVLFVAAADKVFDQNRTLQSDEEKPP